MQKQVSKQSLAVLALSILLAISMALTATFAVFSGSNTATGSIEFTASGLTVELSKTGGGNFVTITSGAASFDVTNADIEIFSDEGTEKIRINAAKAAEIESIVYTIDTTSDRQFKYSVTSTAASWANGLITFTETEETTATADVTNANLGLKCNAIAAPTTDIAKVTFTITVNAAYVLS